MNVEGTYRPEAEMCRTAPDASGESTAGRRWVSRAFVVALLAVPMLVALGGTSHADELDPAIGETTEIVTEPLDQVVNETTETVAEVAEPVVETATETVEPVVETATDTVAPVVETVSDTVDTVLETVEPLGETVQVVLSGGNGVGGGTGVDPVPQGPSSGVTPPNPGAPAAAADRLEHLVTFDHGRAVVDSPGGAAWSPNRPDASSSVAEEVGTDASPGRASRGFGSVPFGRTAATPMTLLVLFAALSACVRVFRPSILFPIASRVFAVNGAALALSVERPG